MGVFYYDRKIYTCRTILNHLVKNHCYPTINHATRTESYRTDKIPITTLANSVNLPIELVIDSCEILASNKHINYEIKGIANKKDSVIALLIDGRDAYKNSFYTTILLKKWGYRFAWFIGIVVSIFTILHFVFFTHDK